MSDTLSIPAFSETDRVTSHRPNEDPIDKPKDGPIDGSIDGSIDGPGLEVDLAAIRDNYRLVQSLAERAIIAPVVKCDGYGLGANAIAHTLITHEQARCFFVAHTKEGTALRAYCRKALPDHTDIQIYVLNGPSQSTLAQYRDDSLTPVINNVHQAELWAHAYPARACALHIDTGMNRLGLSAEKAGMISAMAGLNVTMVMSHLACASDMTDPANARQRAKFLSLATQFPDARLSLAASGAALETPGYHYSLIRFGVSLYGAFAGSTPDPRLKTVATLTAPVIQLRDVKKGEAVGYDATWRAARPTRLATLAIGYGDGLPRTLSNTGSVWLDGQSVPIAGRISMDLTTVDITDLPQGLAIGDRAELFGPHQTLHDLASQADTIGYEILTSLGHRIDRRYSNG